MVRTRRQQAIEQPQANGTPEAIQLQNKRAATTPDVSANDAGHEQDSCSTTGLVIPANNVEDCHMLTVSANEHESSTNPNAIELAHEIQTVNGVDRLDGLQLSTNPSDKEELPQLTPNHKVKEELESMDIDKAELKDGLDNFTKEEDLEDERVVKKLRIDDVVALQEDIDTLPQKRKRVPSKKATPTKAKKAPTIKLEPLRRTKRPGVWSVEHLLTNKRSKIIQTESDIFFNPSSWNLFTAAEKEGLLGLLPSVDTEDLECDQAGDVAPHDLFNKLKNDAFRTAYRDLQEDLDNGYWEPAFIKKAEKAAEERVGAMADMIDSYKNGEYEAYWGQHQKIFHEDAGDATKIELQELCKHNKFSKGDVFEFYRKFRKGNIMVEKQLILQDISYTDVSDPDRSKTAFALTFTMPPGMTRYPVPVDDTVSHDPAAIARSVQVDTLQKLMDLVLDEDGRAKEYHPKKYPNSNSWKLFKVYRNHQLVGTPHEIRQKYFHR